MNKLQKLVKYTFDPDYRFSIDSRHGKYDKMPDEEYLKRLYKYKMGKDLNLANPQTFNEKLQWLKLHDRKPIYTKMVDKYEAKKLIAEKIGEQHVIPTLGVWDAFDEIDFASLPDSFVLKCTHNSGGVVVCRDKKTFDADYTREKLSRVLKKNYYYHGREWPYKNVKPRIIAEPLVQNADNSALTEYNFFCFNGEPRMFMCCYGDRDRGETRYNDYFMVDGTRLPIRWGNKCSPNSKFEHFGAYNDMCNMARVLSKDIPLLRVDFYLCDGKALVGELTFFSWSGLMPIEPPEWDGRFGDWIHLPEANA